DWRAVLELLGAMPLLAADQHRIRLAERAAHALDGGIEGRLQLVVVGGQRGVGDLHPWSGGGHDGWRASGWLVPQARLRTGDRGRSALSHRSVAGPARTKETPKARLRGEKSLAFDAPIIDAPIRACNAIPALNP